MQWDLRAECFARVAHILIEFSFPLRLHFVIVIYGICVFLSFFTYVFWEFGWKLILLTPLKLIYQHRWSKNKIRNVSLCSAAVNHSSCSLKYSNGSAQQINIISRRETKSHRIDRSVTIGIRILLSGTWSCFHEVITCRAAPIVMLTMRMWPTCIRCLSSSWLRMNGRKERGEQRVGALKVSLFHCSTSNEHKCMQIHFSLADVNIAN